MRNHLQIKYIRHESSCKQLEVKTNRASFYVEILTDITTRNEECKDTQKKVSNMDPIEKPRVTSGVHEG